ncbi:hypothetical protein LTR94_037579, partial [Friedmanniomyces endolithicus]
THEARPGRHLDPDQQPLRQHEDRLWSRRRPDPVLRGLGGADPLNEVRRHRQGHVRGGERAWHPHPLGRGLGHGRQTA